MRIGDDDRPAERRDTVGDTNESTKKGCIASHRVTEGAGGTIKLSEHGAAVALGKIALLLDSNGMSIGLLGP
jgi:hypothetical protein